MSSKAHINWEFWSLHGSNWWRNRWERSGLVEVEHADLVPDGWRHWLHSDRASGHDQRNSTWVAALEADGGRTLGFSRIVTKILRVDIGVLGMHTWWMDEGTQYSAEEVDRMFRVLTKPGITAAFGLGASSTRCRVESTTGAHVSAD